MLALPRWRMYGSKDYRCILVSSVWICTLRSWDLCQCSFVTDACCVQLNELMDPESGFLGREGLILRVDVLECCPWFEFADLETYTSGMTSLYSLF